MATLAESFLADLDDLSDASGDDDLDARDGDGDIQVIGKGLLGSVVCRLWEGLVMFNKYPHEGESKSKYAYASNQPTASLVLMAYQIQI